MMVPRPIHIVAPEGAAVLNLEVYEESGEMICAIRHMVGEINALPKRWLGAVRREIGNIEALVRNAGCAELRVAGRDWSRILTDYEPLPGIPNRLRKRL